MTAIADPLIYEVWKGIPVYYKGYQDVLAGKKTVGSIRFCSDLQGVLVALLNGKLGCGLNRKKYLLATNQIGVQIAPDAILCHDLAVFDKEKIGKLKGKYFDIPPKIVIEVDIKADVAEFEKGADGYVMQKAQKLLDFGVEKVFWIITGMHRVYVIDRQDPTWHIVDWAESIHIMDDCTLVIKQLLDDEAITY